MKSAELLSWLRSRRSVRKFKPDPVPEATINQILETATWAPNAHNRQPWRFAVLTGEEAKSDLTEAMAPEFKRALTAEGAPPEEIEKALARSRRRIMGAPVVILLCLQPEVMNTYADPTRQEGEYLIAVQSVAMAGSHLLLAAHAEGLGGVWNCAPLFAPSQVRQALGLPKSWEAQGMVLLGYPAGEPSERHRKPPEDVIRFI